MLVRNFWKKLIKVCLKISESEKGFIQCTGFFNQKHQGIWKLYYIIHVWGECSNGEIEKT